MLGKIDSLDSGVVTARWARLEEEAIAILGREGFAPGQCRLQRFGALRYFGQTHELSVPWPAEPVDRAVLLRMVNLFEEAHHKTYGHRGHDNIIELVNLHLVANGLSIRPRVPSALEFQREAEVITKQRPVWFGPEIGMHHVKVMSRSALPESALQGPLIVSEFDTTIVVPPDFHVTRDKWFNIVLTQYRSSVADAANKSAVLTPTM